MQNAQLIHAISAFVFLMPAAIAAQTPNPMGGNPPVNLAASAPQTNPNDLCALEGRVVDAATGEPVRKASLVLNRTDAARSASGLPQSFSTSSDASGGFAMKNLEPGSYRLRASRNGFVTTEYGARRASSAGTVLSLRRGQQMKDVEIRLTPHGVVTGRILDEDGEPVASASTQLLKLQYVNGKKQLTATGAGTTNDLGEYRVFGLAPGKYYVSASFLIADSTSADRSAAPRPEEDYVPTYYPGTRDPASAVPIEVAAGAQAARIDMVLAKTHTVTIKGHVNPAGAVPMLYMAPRSLFGPVSLKMVRVDAKGDFEIRGVAPGAYALTGSTRQNGKAYSSSLPVDAGSANIEGLTFTIEPGFPVAGRLRVDGETKEDFSKVQVRLQAREMGIGSLMAAMGSALTGGTPGAATGKVEKDLSFRLEDVNADRYDVTLSGLADGFYVSAIRCGDADVLLSGLALSGGPPEPVEIVVSPRAGQIGGSVQNPKTLQPAPEATVALVPQEKERRDRPVYYQQATTDQSGRFTFKNLPPGGYRVFAFEDVEDGAWMDPDFMKPLETKGEPVTVRESGQETVQLKLIPADAPGNPARER